VTYLVVLESVFPQILTAVVSYGRELLRMDVLTSETC